MQVHDLSARNLSLFDIPLSISLESDFTPTNQEIHKLKILQPSFIFTLIFITITRSFQSLIDRAVARYLLSTIIIFIFIFTSSPTFITYSFYLAEVQVGFP